MRPEPVVYMVQDPPPMYVNGRATTRDLSSASRYGRFHFVLDKSDQPSVAPGPTFQKVKRELKDFDPTQDFLCFAGGDPMSLALAALALRDMNVHGFDILQFNRERDTDGRRKAGSGYYMPVHVPLRG